MAIGGCRTKDTQTNKIRSYKLIELEKRVSKIESKLNNIENDSLSTTKNIITVKSLTFRIGSEDDRLRIYWSNGERTDLPCTKEQNIWACG